MDFITQPQKIEHRSMELIAPYLDGLNLSPEAVKVFSRIIHASGDPDYANHINLHPQAITAARQALKHGVDIYTDVEMVRTGINRRRLAENGGQTHCLIGDDQVAKVAVSQGITRSMAAMRAFGNRMEGAIIAVGNAPTALFEVLRLMRETPLRPSLIVGVPVGFVGAAESKALLAEQSPVPYITVAGTKGGSPIAAAIINALLYLE